jgi:hypothetical protein
VLLNGGQKIEDTDAFREALIRERERLRLEQEVGFLPHLLILKSWYAKLKFTSIAFFVSFSIRYYQKLISYVSYK